MTPTLKYTLVAGGVLLALLLVFRACVGGDASGPQPTRGVGQSTSH